MFDQPPGTSGGCLLITMFCGLLLLGGCTSVQVGDKDSLASGRQEPVPVKPGVRAFDKRVGEQDNRFQVSLDGFQAVMVKQEQPVWCWAASAEMIHKFLNSPMSQEQIVERIKKLAANDPKAVEAAGRNEIMLALNPDLVDEYNQSNRLDLIANSVAENRYDAEDVVSYAQSQIERQSINSDKIIDALCAGEPVIIGLNNPDTSTGHACVAFAAEYGRLKEDKLGQTIGQLFNNAHKYALHGIWYADPWTGKTAWLSGEAFKKRIDFVMTTSEARQLLQRELKALGGSSTGQH